MFSIARRVVVAVLGAVMLAGLTSAPAQADERPCVSRVEYNNISFTWPPATQGRVHDHFDTRGFLTERWGPPAQRDVVRGYPKCRQWGRGNVFVWFDNYSWDWRARVYAMTDNGVAYRNGNWTYIQ